MVHTYSSRRLRPGYCKFKASFVYVVRLKIACVKKALSQKFKKKKLEKNVLLVTTTLQIQSGCVI